MTNRQKRKQRSDSKIYTYNGDTHTLTEWAEILQITTSAIRKRMSAGKTVDEIFSTDRRVVDGKKTDLKKYLRKLEREAEDRENGIIN